MTKHGFEIALRSRLEAHGLSSEEIQKSVDYYAEMLDDRMEDGMTEADAVDAMGDMDAIIREILLDAPLGTLVKNKIKPKREFSSGETALLITLAILGFPIWFSLLMGLLCIIAGVYVTILALIFATGCVVFSVFICGVALIAGGIMLLPVSPAGGIALFGTAFLLIGIAILLYFPAKYAVIGLLKLTSLILRGIKSLFIGKKKETEVHI